MSIYKGKRKVITLRLKEDLAERLKELADESRRPLNEEIEIAIKSYLDSERLEKEKTKAIQVAAQMSLKDLCVEKTFVIFKKDEEIQYSYSNFPGVYKVEIFNPNSLSNSCTYEVVTKKHYEELIKEEENL